MNSAPISGTYVMIDRIGTPSRNPMLPSSLRLQEQIDHPEKNDAPAHDQRVVLHDSALHSPQRARSPPGRPRYAVDRAVDDELVEDRHPVASDEHRYVTDQIHE